MAGKYNRFGQQKSYGAGGKTPKLVKVKDTKVQKFKVKGVFTDPETGVTTLKKQKYKVYTTDSKDEMPIKKVKLGKEKIKKVRRKKRAAKLTEQARKLDFGATYQTVVKPGGKEGVATYTPGTIGQQGIFKVKAGKTVLKGSKVRRRKVGEKMITGPKGKTFGEKTQEFHSLPTATTPGLTAGTRTVSRTPKPIGGPRYPGTNIPKPFAFGKKTITPPTKPFAAQSFKSQVAEAKGISTSLKGGAGKPQLTYLKGDVPPVAKSPITSGEQTFKFTPSLTKGTPGKKDFPIKVNFPKYTGAKGMKVGIIDSYFKGGTMKYAHGGMKYKHGGMAGKGQHD